MVRRILLISLTIIISATSLAFVTAGESIEASVHPVDEAARQQILQATLRITLLAKADVEEGPAVQTHYALGQGLGTLVQKDGATYIVTHDHWSRLANKVRVVLLESAAGDPLLELDPSRFYSLIRYRDGGTLVMLAPEELLGNSSAKAVVATDAPVQEGQTLSIVYWQPESEEQVTVEPVTVQEVEEYKDRPSLVMKSLNGKVVVQGNSGGGVYAGTQLVGNMWETIVARHLENGQPNGQSSPTDLSRAARLIYDGEDPAGAASDFYAAPNQHGEI